MYRPPNISVSLAYVHVSSLEGTGVATSSSGPFENLGDGGRERGALLQWNGHPRVLDIPIPKTLVIWASSSHITLAIWVRVRIRVRVTRDAHITGFLGMGMPLSLWQRAPLPFSKEKALGRGYGEGWGGGGASSKELIRRLQPHVYMRLFLRTGPSF